MMEHRGIFTALGLAHIPLRPLCSFDTLYLFTDRGALFGGVCRSPFGLISSHTLLGSRWSIFPVFP